MSRDSNGNYNLPAGNPVISGTVIQTQWANPTMADIGAALTDSLSRSGKGGMGAVLAMGGFKISALGAALAATDAPQSSQVRDQSFVWLNPVQSDSTGNSYAGTALLSTPPVNGTMYQFLADKDNTGAMTLSVNGSSPLPVLLHGAATPPSLVLTGSVLQVAYYNATYRIVSTAGIGGGTVNSVQSNNVNVISVLNDYSVAIATLQIHANVPSGLVQLDGSTKVPISLLPFTDLEFIGAWNATPGVNPAAAQNGQFYIIVGAGNLTIFRNSGGNVYTAQVTACVVGDAIIFNSAGTVNQPTGWYYDPAAAAPAVAGTTSMVATPTLPAVTNLQSWLNQMDPIIAGKLSLTGGTMSGPILQPTAPGSATALANKQYVDDKVSSTVGVLSFNARVGAVTLVSADVTSALGFAPAALTGAAFTGPISAPSASIAGNISVKAVTPVMFTGNLGASAAIDFTNGQSQVLTLTANCVLTGINNIPNASILRVVLLATAFTVTWPAAVKWPLGVAPNLAAGPLKKALVVFEQLPDGDILATSTVY